MIDFHNHILPNVDDGPKTIEESVSMIEFAYKQGITDIVQTVHFQHPKMYNKNVDYSFLVNKTKELQSCIYKKKIDIKIHLSAEVFYLPNLVEISSNPLVTIGNNKYMLIEFKANIFPENFEDQFYQLQLNGITPIVAHPERYRFIQNDINILEKWISRGYIIQLDAGSILGNFGKKIEETSFQMINSGFIHLIGSDAHNNKKRNFCLKTTYDLLENNYGYEFISFLKQNASNILSGEKIENIDLVKYRKKSINLIFNISKLVNNFRNK